MWLFRSVQKFHKHFRVWVGLFSVSWLSNSHLLFHLIVLTSTSLFHFCSFSFLFDHLHSVEFCSLSSSSSLVLTLGGASNMDAECNSCGAKNCVMLLRMHIHICTRNSIMQCLALQWHHLFSQDSYWSFSCAYQWFIRRFLIERAYLYNEKGRFPTI